MENFTNVKEEKWIDTEHEAFIEGMKLFKRIGYYCAAREDKERSPSPHTCIQSF